ncbi:MAG: bromoperoxidase [Elusimicrobia bacterium GWF2_52_66]|nr:MAG: bromoperoxidase [Elusimicrobia bacterium GWA2_51_34]OGR85729.1 MAG: bromoperoxidase [Elusimicrobia bacterium GWF2_52_66]HAF94895.1 alpha/beta hydrolase [Elusimicrobiota bacterium]HCE97066.1 alpha/beta hydrolase [Elusimicrobiota bacterium]
MPYINVGEENSGSIDLYYEDLGTGNPVVLIHGWPLSGASWEKQVTVLLAAGYRVITYDRRGFGQSAKPVTGYDYDTFSMDLYKLIAKLDLRNVALVGFSMGGGEVARYLGRYGSERVSKAVFISSVPPFLLKTADNPEGVDSSVFEGIKKALAADRPAFLSAFLADFYNVDLLGGKLISNQVVQYNWNVGVAASAKATFDCVSQWGTDFSKDLSRIDVPTLVIHGNADRILPVAATGIRTHKAVRGSRLVIVEGGPHGLTWTHAEKVNHELVEFLGLASAEACRNSQGRETCFAGHSVSGEIL